MMTTTITTIFSLSYLLLAMFFSQVNLHQFLDIEGMNRTVTKWLKDKSMAKSNYGSIGGWEFCSGISFNGLFYVDSRYSGNDKAQTFNYDISGLDMS